MSGRSRCCTSCRVTTLGASARNAQGQRIVDDVRASQPAAQRPGPRDGCRHRDDALRNGPRAPVVGRRLRRQAFGRIGRHRRQEHAVVELTHAPETAQELSHVGLAAAELAGDEREE